VTSHYCVVVQCCINTYIIHPPMFHNLARLNFQGCCCYWLVLQSMFERAPNLEEIVFEPRLYSCNVMWKSFSKHLFNKLNRVPQSLVSHLTSFHLECFKWSSDELELVRDILEKARFLKKLTITSNLKDLEENPVLLKELLCFPRLSRKCKIAIVN
jgi:hypothetical protein